jgi:hypothetical protein
VHTTFSLILTGRYKVTVVQLTILQVLHCWSQKYCAILFPKTFIESKVSYFNDVSYFMVYTICLNDERLSPPVFVFFGESGVRKLIIIRYELRVLSI